MDQIFKGIPAVFYGRIATALATALGTALLTAYPVVYAAVCAQ